MYEPRLHTCLRGRYLEIQSIPTTVLSKWNGPEVLFEQDLQNYLKHVAPKI